MEMVEEVIYQPESSPKQNEVGVIEEDRISELPDGLILEILSLLPSTKSAIRTGTLSKRWKYLWTLVPTLIFIQGYDIHSPSDFVFFVDKTLSQCRQRKLRQFRVDIEYDSRFEIKINNWIHFAVRCNVEVLYLGVGSSGFEGVFPLNQNFFNNSCFADLTLKSCIFNPTREISWRRLRRLYIDCGYLEEHVIENILSGSPLLESLLLDTCYGYRLLDITSKSVKKLVFFGYNDPDDEYDDLADIIEINAPNVLSLSIKSGLLLWKLLLLNVSSLVEANLDYTKGGDYDESTEEEAEEEMLKGLIQSLSHVKELKIGFECSKVVIRLEAKGFTFPSNVKFPDGMFSYNDWDEQDYWSDSDWDESKEREVFLLDHGGNS